MPNGYTHKIYDGTDLNVSHYIINVARGFGLLMHLRDDRFGIYDKERLYNKQSSYHKTLIDSIKLKLANAEKLPQVLRETEVEKLNKELQYHTEGYNKDVEKQNQTNAMIDALFDSLPEDINNYPFEKKEKKIDENTFLFGEDYTLEKAISYLQNLDAYGQIKLHDLKIQYETKEYERQLAEENAMELRYTTMIDKVNAWNPVCTIQDKKLAAETNGVLSNIKKAALKYLEESKDFDCGHYANKKIIEKYSKMNIDEYCALKLYELENEKSRMNQRENEPSF